MNKRILSLIAILAVLLVAFAGTKPVFAQELTEISGTILTVDEATLTLTVDTGTTGVITVTLPAGFDFTTVLVGDVVTVSGTVGESGAFTASSVTVTPATYLLTGTVVSVDETLGTITVDTGSGVMVTITVPEGFDFTTVLVGDVIGVNGTANEDGSVTATDVVVNPEITPVEEVNTGYYCEQSENAHPVGSRLAERFGMEYTTLQTWFCNGSGWGEIALALQTSRLTSGDPETLLTERENGSGWGQIWQVMGLNGHDVHEDADKTNNGHNQDDDTTTHGNGNGNSNSNGNNNRDREHSNNGHNNP
jgi:hypothetical protein